MTTAREVQDAARLADIDEETLLKTCGATRADLEGLNRKLNELQALSEPPDVLMSDFFTPAEGRLLMFKAAQWRASEVRARMPVSDEKQ